jgi:glycosyltransferase involved in cell wall biosynthesis
MEAVFTSYYGDLGGGELRLLEYLRLTRVARSRLSVVLCAPGPFGGRIRELGISVHVIPWNRAARRPWRTVQTALAAWRLRRHLRRRRARVVFANTYNDLLLAGPVARALGVPVLWRSHADVFPNAAEPARRGLVAFVCDHVARVLATTDYDARLIVGAGVPASAVHVVRLGVDCDLYADPVGERRARMRAALGIPPAAPLLGFIGRLVPQKGHLVFFEALHRVVTAFPAVRALVVGDSAADGSDPDGYRSVVRRAVERLGLEKHVRFLGFRDDVPEILAAIDLFVHASLREPFGSVIAEALAAGKPVIASRTRGPEELLEDGVTGLLTPPGDAPALGEAIARLLLDTELARSLAERGHAMVRERYDLSQTVAEMDRHLLETAERGR